MFKKALVSEVKNTGRRKVFSKNLKTFKVTNPDL